MKLTDYPMPIQMALGAHEFMRRLNVPSEAIYIDFTDKGLAVILSGTAFQVGTIEATPEEVEKFWIAATARWNAVDTPLDENMDVFNAFKAAVHVPTFIRTVQILNDVQA